MGETWYYFFFLYFSRIYLQSHLSLHFFYEKIFKLLMTFLFVLGLFRYVSFFFKSINLCVVYYINYATIVMVAWYLEVLYHSVELTCLSVLNIPLSFKNISTYVSLCHTIFHLWYFFLWHIFLHLLAFSFLILYIYGFSLVNII